MGETRIAVMGSFVADLAFRTPDLPAWGQTMLGSAFRLGPGGKGSNQAVAAARLGATVSFITKLGRDSFGDLARQTFEREQIDTQFCFETTEYPTGAAAIIVHELKGENAIVVVPGACFHLTTAEVDRSRALLGQSSVFITQLELKIPIVVHGLTLARSLGVPTILNPAPALDLPAAIYPLCDYLTPNESEAAGLIGGRVSDIGEAERAADILLGRGVKNVVITLGPGGALVRNSALSKHVAAIDAGPVIETTGAGDAFNGGFAVALAEGLDVVSAARFACAVAGISVTRYGTAPSMPTRSEVDALLTNTTN